MLGTIYIIAAVMHRMSLELFAPNTVLYDLAATGNANMNGAARAALWFEILSVWMPLLVIGGITAFVVIREYRRQVQTATRARP